MRHFNPELSSMYQKHEELKSIIEEKQHALEQAISNHESSEKILQLRNELDNFQKEMSLINPTDFQAKSLIAEAGFLNKAQHVKSEPQDKPISKEKLLEDQGYNESDFEGLTKN